MRASALALAAAMALSVPGMAHAWSLSADIWTGASRQDATSLKSGLSLAQGDVLQGSFNATGLTAILKVGLLEAGLLWEGGLDFRSTQSGVVGPLLGVGLEPLDWLRVEGLAEIGGHQLSNIGGGSGLSISGDTSAWLPYVGLRPGVSLRLPVGPVKMILGAWAFARWDLQSKQATVNITSQAGTTVNTYQLGGSTVGLVGRVGVEF